MANDKILVVFDFDQTIAHEDSVSGVEELVLSGVPQEIVDKWEVEQNWNAYCVGLFGWVHREGVREQSIKNAILTRSLSRGMESLFRYISEPQFDVIVISDSNILFINWFLQHNNLDKVVERVYANPASFDADSKLSLQFYHYQDSCSLCPKNLCKGIVLDNHIEEKRAAGTNYSTVCYVGDSENDTCPSLRLSQRDYAFPRAGFPLQGILQSETSSMKAAVLPWECATSIQKTLRCLCVASD